MADLVRTSKTPIEILLNEHHNLSLSVMLAYEALSSMVKLTISSTVLSPLNPFLLSSSSSCPDLRIGSLIP